MGRSLAIGGAGAGLSSRPLGMFGGLEYVAITEAQLAQHAHVWVPNYSYVEAYTGIYGYAGWGSNASGGVGATGGNAGHMNFQPSTVVNVMMCA